jgi:hypothetical protein
LVSVPRYYRVKMLKRQIANISAKSLTATLHRESLDCRIDRDRCVSCTGVHKEHKQNLLAGYLSTVCWSFRCDGGKYSQ